MAGPERPCRALTAGEEGGTHAAQQRCQYEGTEVKCLTDPLMVKAEQLRQVSRGQRDPMCDRGTQLSHMTTHSGNIQLVFLLHRSWFPNLRSWKHCEKQEEHKDV